MGTHPIFESDFDCLTEFSQRMINPVAAIVRDVVPNYLKSVPIPYGFSDLKEMGLKDWAHLVIFIGASTGAGYIASRKITELGRANTTIKLDQDKVVDKFSAKDIEGKAVYCRCWKSKKFPYCDGAHNAHNKATGDNLGPLIITE